MESKIKIEPIISTPKNRMLFWVKSSSIIQTKPFRLSLKITNIGDEPVKGFTVKKIEFKSAAEQRIIHNVDKSFHVDTLNPDTSTELKVDEFGTYMHGLAQVNLDIVSDDPSNIIKTYQKDPFTEEVSEYGYSNKWLDFLYVTSSAEYAQSTNNNFLVFLTALMILGIAAQIYIAARQINYTELQSRGERIYQARKEKEAIDFCKKNPQSEESGLFYASGGLVGVSAPCSEVIRKFNIQISD